jgi:hypothetical protein
MFGNLSSDWPAGKQFPSISRPAGAHHGFPEGHRVAVHAYGAGVQIYAIE